MMMTNGAGGSASVGEGCSDTRTQTRMIQMALRFSGGETHDYRYYAIYAYRFMHADARCDLRYRMPDTIRILDAIMMTHGCYRGAHRETQTRRLPKSPPPREMLTDD